MSGPGTHDAGPRSWPARADLAQLSLDHFYGADEPQLLDNTCPAGDNEVFQYWWLAHLVDCRLDAFGRTGDPRWVELAVRTSDNILQRNGGSPYNDYFDDMLWWALSSLRLDEAGAGTVHRDRAVALWEHVVELGWNDIHGPSLAWRKQQLYYKNTPANGPLVILSARLFGLIGERRYLDTATAALSWLESTLVEPSGFVHDGINREADGRIDAQWRFTYNQGLYVGAVVALARVTDDPSLLERAERTALTAIAELAEDGIFSDEGDGGDIGLFKGICYRYLGLLIDALPTDSTTRRRLERFVRAGTDVLWSHAEHDGWLFPGNDWLTAVSPHDPAVPYSTMLSAIMATELRARLDQGQPGRP